MSRLRMRDLLTGLRRWTPWQRPTTPATVCSICHLPLNARGWCPVHHLGAERKRG